MFEKAIAAEGLNHAGRSPIVTPPTKALQAAGPRKDRRQSISPEARCLSRQVRCWYSARRPKGTARSTGGSDRAIVLAGVLAAKIFPRSVIAIRCHSHVSLDRKVNVCANFTGYFSSASSAPAGFGG